MTRLTDDRNSGHDYGPGCDRHKGDPHNLCEPCWELESGEPLTPLADHGHPLGLLGTLWAVIRGGVRLYG